MGNYPLVFKILTCINLHLNIAHNMNVKSKNDGLVLVFAEGLPHQIQFLKT